MFMVSEKGFCLPQHKFPTVIQLTTNKYIILIIRFYIFFQGTYGAFHVQLRGFDFINYIYIQTQTNLAGWCPKVLKSTCNCMAKTDHSGQRKGKNRCQHFPDFINPLWNIFSQMWSSSKHPKLNIYFLNLANPIFFKP